MKVSQLWEFYANEVSRNGGSPTEPTPSEAWGGFLATLKEPVDDFDSNRHEDIALFQVGPARTRQPRGELTASLDRRLFLGDHGDQIWVLTIRWWLANDAGDPVESQIMGRGPSSTTGEGLLSTQEFIRQVADGPELPRLSRYAVRRVRASFDAP